MKKDKLAFVIFGKKNRNPEREDLLTEAEVREVIEAFLHGFPDLYNISATGIINALYGDLSRISGDMGDTRAGARPSFEIINTHTIGERRASPRKVKLISHKGDRELWVEMVERRGVRAGFVVVCNYLRRPSETAASHVIQLMDELPHRVEWQ